MFGLLALIREFFEKCPICGGDLKMMSQGIMGDNYVCTRCGHKWHS